MGKTSQRGGRKSRYWRGSKKSGWAWKKRGGSSSSAAASGGSGGGGGKRKKTTQGGGETKRASLDRSSSSRGAAAARPGRGAAATGSMGLPKRFGSSGYAV